MTIGESLLVPAPDEADPARAAMDPASRQLSLADPALAGRAARNMIAEIAGDIAGDRAGDRADLLALVEAYANDFSVLRDELRETAAGLAELRLNLRDMTGRAAPAPSFLVAAMQGEGGGTSPDGGPILSLPPGEYMLEVPDLGLRQRVSLQAGENEVALTAENGLLVELAPDWLKADAPHPLLIPLLAPDERPAALASLRAPGPMADIPTPRADAPPEAISRALEAARAFLRGYEAGGRKLPEEEPARFRAAFSRDLAWKTLALYGDPERDGALLLGREGADPGWSRRFRGRVNLTALLEARGGRLESGLLAHELGREVNAARLVPGLVLHRYGVGAGTRAVLDMLAQPPDLSAEPAYAPGDGLIPWDMAFALQQMLGLDAPELGRAARGVLSAAQSEHPLPKGAVGAALAWLLTHESLPAELAARGALPPLSEDDLLYLAPLMADSRPVLHLLERFSSDAFAPTRLLFARRGLPDTAAERDAVLDAVAAIAPEPGIGASAGPKVVSSLIEIASFLPSETAAGMAYGGQGRGTRYQAARGLPDTMPEFTFRPWLADQAVEALRLAERQYERNMFFAGYLPFAQADALIGRADLSAWPDPALIRAALPLVGHAFRDPALSWSIPVGRKAGPGFTIPFIIGDPQSAASEGYGGASSGVLRIMPARIGRLLRFDIRLDYKNFYPDRCAFGICNQFGEYRFHRFVTANAARIVEDLRLIRLNAPDRPRSLPATRREFDDFTRFELRLEEGTDGADAGLGGLALAFTLRFGAVSVPVVRPLWNTEFAADQRRASGLRRRAKALIAEEASDPGALADLARELAAAGQSAEAASAFAAWGARTGDAVEGALLAAETLLAAGAPGEAVGGLRAALEGSPGQGDLQFALGVALGEAEDHAGAARAFEALLEANPADAEARSLAAFNMFHAGELGAALDLLAPVPLAERAPRERLLGMIIGRLRGAQQARPEDFIADLLTVAAMRGAGAVPSPEALSKALDGARGEEAIPAQCDIAAWGGQWLASASGERERARAEDWMRQARRLCPPGDPARHLAHAAD